MAVFSMVGGAIAAGQSKKAARRARSDKQRAEAELDSIKASRQQIRNPYATTVDLSALATDLSGQLSNPFENLGVATKAAEIQIDQADIALANTLDNLRATGASAGGATALAQAALQSKQGVAASIEQQEAQNEKLRAQGEQQLMQARMAEQQRLQNIAISEGQRIQEADAKGKLFEFQAQEERTNADISYNIAKETGAAQRENQAQRDRSKAIGGIFTGIGNIAGSVIGAEATAAAGNGSIFD